MAGRSPTWVTLAELFPRTNLRQSLNGGGRLLSTHETNSARQKTPQKTSLHLVCCDHEEVISPFSKSALSMTILRCYKQAGE